VLGKLHVEVYVGAIRRHICQRIYLYKESALGRPARRHVPESRTGLYEGIGWSDTEAYAGVLQGRTIRKGVPEHNFFYTLKGKLF
jgi:hypothetical protein